jgi:prolyl-tRNA editing enzyme YbaK/EbsC (Cys-tRNA(Pro) deacylase)
MSDALNASAQKVQDALDARGYAHCRVIEMPDSTRTAAEAAAAIGCTVAQIAKSLVFRGAQTGAPILVIASGTNRVDPQRLAALAGEPVEKPDADYVRQRTGFVIGGVPPLGHSEPLRTFIDRDLLAFEDIWAAAGTPRAVFHLTPGELVSMTGGEIATIA